ncbi:GEVED domain-containing protein [Flavobacterium sp.]|uniref:Ig-like domain-containing protein n=1 Tax=Flavobacterium sp. TaxID=239 RepID=UPI003D6BF0CF
MMKNYFFQVKGCALLRACSFNPKSLSGKSFVNSTRSFSFFLILTLGTFLIGTTQVYSQIAQRGTSTTANSGNTSLTINKPTGVVTGDIMIVNIAQVGSNNLSNPTCTGWTLINGQDLAGGTDRWGAVLYKIALAGEPANYTFTLDGDSTGNVGSIVAFSGVNTTTPFDVASGTISVQGNQTGVVATGKTTVTANAAIIMFGMAANNDPTWGSWNTTSPGALTELYDNQRNNDASVGAAWAIKATAGATGNGTATLSNGERNGGILIALRPATIATPTITSLSATSGCPGSSFIINGTNLAGATAVTIGGTAATITATTATTVTVTVGSGTTGQVSVTTPGGTANSGITNFTINTPANPGNPTSNSPQCNPTGVTITRSGAPGGGITWYWQTVSGGTSTANNSTTPLVVTTSGTYYIRAYNGTCWSNGEGSVAVTVNNPIATLATAPSPSAGATGICYTGTGAVSSISWTAAAGANSYDVYFGTTAVPPFVVNQAGVTYNTGALSANTTYYWKIVPRTTLCGITTGTPITWSFTTNMVPCHCIPSSTSGGTYISGITSIGTLNDVANAPTGYSAGGYGDYSGIVIATQIPGGGINTNINIAGTSYIKTFVDWNNDGDFVDAGETVYTTGGTATGDTSYGFIVPVAQTPGNYRMRVRTRAFAESSTIDPCTTGYLTGETEDYTITIVADCVAKITSVSNGASCGVGSTVTIGATGVAGTTQYRWYAAETGGAPVATTATGSWTTGALAATTTYYVTAYNGTCESWNRTAVKATINPTTNITISPTTPIFCGDNDILTISATGDFTVEDLFVEDFESGLGGLTVTTPTNNNGGADSVWSVKTSTYAPTTTAVWRPAINSGSIGDKFAFTSSDYSGQTLETLLTTTASINASSYIDLTLTFKHYYSDYGSDTASIQVSTDGGGTWTNTPVTYNSDLGSASQFTDATIDLTAFAGQSNLKFRFRYAAGWADGWAIDDIRLYGTRPLNTTFTWGGGTVDAYTDLACTIPYVAQSLTTIYVKPNATQLASTTWSFTVSATLGNGCVASKPITVTNNTKTWIGGTSNWATASNWSPSGVPTAANCVVIPSSSSSVISGSGYNAFAKNLKIKSSGNLELQSTNNLTIDDWVNVDATGLFTVRNSANLVQVNNVANTGNIKMERITNIRRLDYVYWSSPVSGVAVNTVSPLTPANVIWKWLPTTPRPYASNFGNWTNANETMVAGKGYIIRGPNGFTTTAQPYTAGFTGVPNNGNISMTILRDTYNGANYTGPTATAVTKDDDNWNLVGNPYPSSISADALISANPDIDGSIRLWTHGTAPSNANPSPFYNNYAYNYSSSDYIVYNSMGSTPPGFAGRIGAGQAFFVLMNHATATPGALTFNNTMRSNTYSNSQFYRSNSNTVNTDEETIERHRIWLDLIAPSGNVNRILVGYAQGATQDRDRLFDATALENGVAQNFYSKIADENMVIQGRALPFNVSDQVPLGVLLPQNGSYNIAIATTDGLFADQSQDIFLEDLSNGTIHNLRNAPYNFTGTAGRYDNRFVLRYTQTTLGNDDFDYSNSVKVFADNHINIVSGNMEIKEVAVYDVLGKTLFTKRKVGKNELIINELNATQSALIVKVTLENNAIVTKKVIF